MKYEGRMKAIEKKLPKPDFEPFQTYHLERDGTYLGPNDERLTREELEALDCNMFIIGWQKEWTEAETETKNINARRHNMKNWLKGYEGKTDSSSLQMAAKLEAYIQEYEDELRRKGLPIEEERDNRPGAGSVEIRLKGE